MENLSISIANESLNLLATQTDIINRREDTKSKAESFFKKEDNSWNLKIIRVEEFAGLDGTETIINEANNTTNKIIAIQSEKKQIQSDAVEAEKKIKSLQSNSKVLTWVVIIALVIAVLFFLTK